MNFAKLRAEAGLSQREVALACGVDQSTVCLWETEKTKPRASLLPKIAKLYNVTVDDLLKEEASNE